VNAKKIYSAALGDHHPKVAYALEGLAQVYRKTMMHGHAQRELLKICTIIEARHGAGSQKFKDKTREVASLSREISAVVVLRRYAKKWVEKVAQKAAEKRHTLEQRGGQGSM
jgi:hypothetical protein